MLHYSEIPPSPRLATRIECFWTMRQEGAGLLHRVLPDGCADLLLMETGGAATLAVVGPMTRYVDQSIAFGQRMFGVRFRPGRWTRILGVPGDRVVDAVAPFEDLRGAPASRLCERLANATTPEERARIVEAFLPPEAEVGPVERAVGFLESAGGCVSIDHLAREAGLSPRQFRRICLDRTGLTPKFLARVLRFRQAAARIDTSAAAGLALDCGYYDQSHLIRDFREFAGRTPALFRQPPGPSSAASL